MSNDKTLRKLSGKWSMNKGRSSDVTPVLEIQGFNLIMRKAAAAAPITLTITQDSPDEIHITQSTTASIPALKEEWHLDWQEQEQKDSFLGKTRSKSRWSTVGQVEGEPFLTQGLNADDEVIEAEVHSLEKGWVAKQVWFVEGGDFVRRVVTTKDEKRAESTLVYEQQ